MTTTTVQEVAWTSYSALNQHRECPQQWYYARERKLARLIEVDPAIERDFGSWWHMLRAAESLERGRALDSLRFVPKTLSAVDDAPELSGETATVDQVLELISQWWERTGDLYREEGINRLGEPLPDRIVDLFAAWKDTWKDEIANEAPIAVEMGWGRDLPSLPDGRNPSTRIVGYADEAYQDIRRNLLVVRDHKTSKALSTQSAADDMMDSQLQLYAWGMAPTVKEWGMSVQATAYDRVRTVKAKTPQVTQAGTLSKSIKDFDLRMYLAWSKGPDGLGVPYPGRMKDGSGAGYYQAEDSVIEMLSSPAAQTAWFQRTLTPLNMNLIKAHLRGAIDSSFDIAETRKRGAEHGQVGRNLSGWGCRWCEFAGLCRAEMVGGVGQGQVYELLDFNLKQR